MVDIKIKDKTYSLYLSSRQVEMVETEMGKDIITCFQECPTSTKFFRLLMQGSMQAKHANYFEDQDVFDLIDTMQAEGWTIDKKAELIVNLLDDAGFMKLPKKGKQTNTKTA